MEQTNTTITEQPTIEISETNPETKPVESKKELAHKIIDELFEKYEKDEYMFYRMQNYICYQVPHILENMKTDHEARIQRIDDLTAEQNALVQSFLLKNPYYYLHATEKFYIYDGLHYQMYSEDDILHNILSTISKETQLRCWKQRTKSIIMKNIKENNLLKSVPESETIQNVLAALYPLFFETKVQAKYFLCILGDNILKKNTDLVHFVDIKTKKFIRELNQLCQLLLGTNCSQSFKHKYHDHEYTNSRLLKFNDIIGHEPSWISILNTITLDLLCVACHYSVRYKNSDEYVLYASNDSAFIENVFYMKYLDQDHLLNHFIKDYLEIDDEKTRKNSEHLLIDDSSLSKTAQRITWKDMQYLWKQFLESKNLPNIVLQQTLKTLMINKLNDFYKESLDSFIGICSKHIPFIRRFMAFWEECIILDENDHTNEFEIGEICFLFKKWCEKNSEFGRNMNDSKILDLITYFFPNIEIDRNKYLYKIKCTLWNKQMDIQMALDHLKAKMRIQHEEILESSVVVAPSPTSTNTKTMWNKKISIYDAYVDYCKFASKLHNNYEQIVGKAFYEKYIMENLEEYIVDTKYISLEWIMY